MMVEDNVMPRKDIIINTFNEMPYPDKYDNHLLKDRSYDILSIKIDDAKEQEKISLGEGQLPCNLRCWSNAAASWPRPWSMPT